MVGSLVGFLGTVKCSGIIVGIEESMAEVDRDKAVSFLKEIFDKLPHLLPSAICLMPMSSEQQEGYHIHLTTSLSPEDRATLEDLAARYGLKVRERESRIVIYESIFQSSG